MTMTEFFTSRGWHADAKLAECQCVAAAQQQIRADISAGVVPSSVRSFAQLHNHVDANGYGWGFDLPFPLEDGPARDQFFALAERVQHALDIWLRSGGHMS